MALKTLYQTSKVTDKKGNDEAAVDIDDSQGWLIGAEYKLPNQSKWAVKAQYS
ncbi:hypothetical protein GCM10011446_10210 [Acinetobacter vivianii]|nr:hypothetical protein GCM10011446_10210 [Acinetobacter vivianii]